MSQFLELFGEYTVAQLVLVICAVVFLYKTYEKVNEYFHAKWKKDEEFKEKLEKYFSKVDTLETTDKRHDEEFNEVKSSLADIKKQLEEDRERERKNTIASVRSTLYRLYYEAVQRGWTNQASVETMAELSKIYLEAGGNSVFKHKLIGEYFDLPMKDVDEYTASETSELVEAVRELTKKAKE